MNASFATITSHMRLNFFSRGTSPEAETQTQAETQPLTGRTFPADEVAWGIAIRNGFDELDDPWHHRGVTQHAYLEGNDDVAICGFRPLQSGPRTRRRSRLGMPTTGEHPMCGMCARMVVAPRPRVAVPIQPARTPLAVPVARPVPQAVAPAPMLVAVPAAPAMPVNATARALPSAPVLPSEPPPLPMTPPRPGPAATDMPASPTPAVGLPAAEPMPHMDEEPQADSDA